MKATLKNNPGTGLTRQQVMNSGTNSAWLVVLLAMACVALPAMSQDLPTACGSLKNHYGPYDYRVDRGETLNVVERAHFTPRIESLIGGNTGTLGSDLSYTLRTFPNHHRALVTAERYAERARTAQPKDMDYTVECYFQRAIAFKRDDLIVRMLFARYLFRSERASEAKGQLEQVAQQKEATAFTFYNIGLVLFEFKEYALAVTYAQRAKEMGFEGDVLINSLKSQGVWRDAASPSAVPASAASK